LAAVRVHSEPASAEPYEAHRDYVLAVLARRCRWLDGDEREAALHDAYVVLLEKQRSHELDLGAMRPPQVRAYLVQTAIHKALDEGKRAERKRSEPLGEGDALPVLADPHPGPEEHAEAHQQGAWIRELIAELPERQQAVVKLRYFFDRTPAEIQDYLGITPRTYRRQIERAVAAISQRYALISEGRFCESRRSLIVAYVAGTADPDRARLAREHLAGCRGCAAWVAGLRSGASKVAALLPIPPLAPVAGPMERIGEGLEAARHAVGDAVGAVKQHAASVVSRVDPSSAAYASGARPGAMVAAAAGCVAIAGGTATYCAVDGVPDPVRSLVGLEHANSRKPGPERPERPEEPPPVAPVVPHAPEETPPSPDAAPAPVPTQSEPLAPAPPPPPPPDEFSVEASGSGSGTSAPAPAAAPPSSSSPPAPPGEFDP
jgi:RNA polymerase sigma factor (sigma-70 family)